MERPYNRPLEAPQVLQGQHPVIYPVKMRNVGGAVLYSLSCGAVSEPRVSPVGTAAVAPRHNRQSIQHGPMPRPPVSRGPQCTIPEALCVLNQKKALNPAAVQGGAKPPGRNGGPPAHRVCVNLQHLHPDKPVSRCLRADARTSHLRCKAWRPHEPRELFR